jgi:hypothetical protein
MPPPPRRVLLVRLRVGAVQRDRGHVPVQPGHVHPELADRRRPDRADGLIQVRSDRVQGTAEPVIVEQVRLDAIHLVHRHRRCPRLHLHQRRRRGQPVRHQRLNHLPVRDRRHLPDRAQLIDHLRDPQPPPELRHHRQCTQPLLQHPDHRDLRPRPATSRPVPGIPLAPDLNYLTRRSLPHHPRSRRTVTWSTTARRSRPGRHLTPAPHPHNTMCEGRV